MSNKYAANHIYSNIGQVPYPFSPYFCIVNKPIEYMETKKTTREEYQKCVNAVVDYINLHLGEEIDLKSLAKISHFSPFYFHRIMKAFGRTRRYVYRPDTYRNGSTVIALHRFADSRHCLSHRLFVFLIIV